METTPRAVVNMLSMGVAVVTVTLAATVKVVAEAVAAAVAEEMAGPGGATHGRRLHLEAPPTRTLT